MCMFCIAHVDCISPHQNFVKIFEQATALAKAAATFSGAMLSQTNFPAAGGRDLQFGGPGGGGGGGGGGQSW